MKGNYDRRKLAEINNLAELKEARRTVELELRLSERRLADRADRIADYFSFRHLAGLAVSKAELVYAAVKTFVKSYRSVFAIFRDKLRGGSPEEDVVCEDGTCDAGTVADGVPTDGSRRSEV